MNLKTIPARTAAGYAALLLLALLTGFVGLWRIGTLNGQVTHLATNIVPSVKILNEAANAVSLAGRAARRMAVSDDATLRAAAEQRYASAKEAALKKCEDYKKLITDRQDGDLFEKAKSLRDRFFVAADKLVTVSKGNDRGQAQKVLADEVDPVLEDTLKAFSDGVDYNSTLSENASRDAGKVVRSSYVAIVTNLLLATLAGTLIGWWTTRATRRELGGISDSLESGATHTSSASAQLTSSSQSLAEGCAEQGSSVAETSAALEQMSVMIRSTADNAERAKAFATQARQAAQAGAATMVDMNTAMQDIEASSAEVAKIVKNIDEIAFQTNILALNAAVEAARAGEAGAGFAVVADEVRSLAQRSAAAARETAEKIEAAIANSRRGSASCEKVGESLHEIVQKVGAADGLVAEISTAAKEQAQGIQQVGLAMTQMDKVTQANASNAAETASAAEELNSQARSLQDLVLHLRALVGSAGATAPPAAVPAPRPGRPRATPPRLPAAAARPARIRDARRPAGHIPMPDHGGAYDDGEDKNFRDF